MSRLHFAAAIYLGAIVLMASLDVAIKRWRKRRARHAAQDMPTVGWSFVKFQGE